MRQVSLSLCAALALTLVASEASAQAGERRFRISGTSTGVGWSWGIIKNGSLFCQGVVASGTVPDGGSSEALRDAFVNSLFLHCPQKIRVRPAKTPSDFTITNMNEDELQFWVGNEAGDPGSGCQVTNNPGGCAFNPTITEIPSTPGASPHLLVGLAGVLLAAGWAWSRRRRELTSS